MQPLHTTGQRYGGGRRGDCPAGFSMLPRSGEFKMSKNAGSRAA
jgi:hypothetical protein